MEQLPFDQILTELKLLRDLIQSTPKDSYRSASIVNLCSSLSLAQGQFKVVGENRQDKYWGAGFADLEAIFKAIRKPLMDNGLSVIQQQQLTDDKIILHTILTHNSGEWIESRCRIVPYKDDSRAFASILNFHKREALCALLGVAIAENPLDDNAESEAIQGLETVAMSLKKHEETPTQRRVIDCITKDQRIELETELSGYPQIAADLLLNLKLLSIADIPKERFRDVCQRVRTIKDKLNSLEPETRKKLSGDTGWKV